MLKFKFTTITPLHISNGELLHENFHYVLKDETGKRRFYKINPLKASKLLAADDNYNLFSALKDVSYTEDYIKTHKEKLINSAAEYSMLTETKFKEFSLKPGLSGQKEVKEFINSNGTFYIPASSIKGALMTVFTEKNDVESIRPLPDFGRIVFRDSEPIPSTSLIVVRSRKRGPEVNLQVVRRNKEFSLTMTKTGNFDASKFRKKLYDYNFRQIELLNEIIQKYTRNKYKKEGPIFDYQQALEQIKELINNKVDIINLGYGGGSWFKVLPGAVPPNNPFDRKPSTSFIFDLDTDSPFSHIGWCKLEIEEL